MGILLDQIAKAKARASGFALDAALEAAGRSEPPAELASAKVLGDRRAFRARR